MIKLHVYLIRYLGNLPLRLLIATVIFICVPSGGIAKELKFCGTHWPPFAYAKDKRVDAGISHELYQEVFRRLNWVVVVDIIPWSRCVKWVEKGVYEAGIDSVPREGMIHGKNPTAFFPLALYVREQSKEEHFSWDLMKGKRVGMIHGYAYTKKIRAFSDWEIHRAKSENQLVKMLNAERLDFILLDLFSAPIVSKIEDIKIRGLIPIVDSAALYPLFNKQLRPEMLKFDNMLSELIKEGIAERIFRKHLSYGYSDLLRLSPESDPNLKAKISYP